MFLTHFNFKSRLYIDLNASKVKGFAAMIYHIAGDADIQDVTKIPRMSVRPILFLSKLLNAAEKNYWFTELEVISICFVIKKIRHMVEASFRIIIMFTDYALAVFILKQISFIMSSMDKLNLWFIKAAQYLLSFDLNIKYKIKKSNIIANALFKLSNNKILFNNTQNILKALFIKPCKLLINNNILVYIIMLVEILNNFKNQLKVGYN